MKISDFLRPELVILKLDASGVTGTIEALVEALRHRHTVARPRALVEALLERERLHTTAMGRGVAVPHTTVEGLDRPVVMVALAPDGIEFGPTGHDPVRVFFMLLSPRNQSGAHIRLLARIARLARHPGFIERLLASPSEAALLETVEQVDAGHV